MLVFRITSCGRSQMSPRWVDVRNLSVVIAAAVLSLTACVGRFERPHVPSVIVVPAPDGKTGKYTLAEYADDLVEYSKASDAGAVKLRNKMVYSLIAEIDYAFFMTMRRNCS